MKIKTIASLEKKRLEAENDLIRSRLEQLPEGEIRFHKSKGAFRWRHVKACGAPKRNRKQYVSLRKRDKNSIELARQLCLKHFLQKQQKLNLFRLQILDQLLLLYPDAGAAAPPDPDMCENYHNLLETFFAPKKAAAEQWASSPYEKSHSFPEDLLYKANNNVYMRSKSEVLIGNKLLDRGLPFHYEQAFPCGDVTYHPDFTILHPVSKEIIIWEHLGLMDKESYIRRKVDRLALLCRYGYHYGKNLIITLESKEAPLEEITVERIIDEVFGEWRLMV